MAMADRVPDPRMLEGLQPVGDLDPEKRAGLAQRGQVIDLRYGDRLDASTEHRWLMYLLEGNVSLVSGGANSTITAGSARAHQPLFS
jgi:hypothetical protein